MSMQELVKIKKFVDDAKIKHAQAVTRQQNLESEFARELDALKKEFAWAAKLNYQNQVALTTETTEKEYGTWEKTLKETIENVLLVLKMQVDVATQAKDEALDEIKTLLRKEGYDI